MRGLRPCLIMDNGHSIEEVEGIMFIGGQDVMLTHDYVGKHTPIHMKY